MNRNIINNIVTAAALLLSAVLSVNTFAQNNVSAYHAGSATPYASFQRLSDALSNGNLADDDIIELNSDIVETTPSTISKNGLVIRSKSGANYTVDLSSYSNFSTAVYTVAANDLNVNNITFANMKGNAGGDSGAIFHVRNNGTTTFGNKCIFRDNEVNISNGCCILVKTPINPSLANKLGTVIVDGAQFIRNTGNHGAAVYLAGLRAELIVKGETLFRENIAKSGCGGAVTVESNAICTVNSGTFTKNEGDFGGGIYLSGKLKVNGGNFTENKKAIVTTNGFEELIVNGGLFEGNTADYGPAIQFQSWGGTPGQAIINGGNFKDNIATKDGGAITVRCDNQEINLEVNGGVFTGNKAGGCGGAINVISGAKMTLTGGTFEGNKATHGKSIDSGGIMCLSGSPVFDDDQDVYLHNNNISGMCTYNVITKIGDLGTSLKVPVTVSSAGVGRDILVSERGATSSSNGKVVAGDLGHISFVSGAPVNYNATGLSSAASAYTPADVIELGGPFRVVSTGTMYPTLQDAVDAAAGTDEIEVIPCSAFSLAEYDAATYSTNNPSSYYQSDWGGEVLIQGKSLTIRPEDSANPAPLKDFVFTVFGDSTLSDVKFEDLKLTGKSKFMVFSGFAGQGINSLSIEDCDIDVNGGLPSRDGPRPVGEVLHRSGSMSIQFPNYTDGASIAFCGSPGGDIGSFQITGTTFKNRNANRYITGRGRFRSVEISNNQFGAADCRYGAYFMVTEDGGYSDKQFTFRIHDNSFYCSSAPVLLYFTTGTFGNTEDNQVLVYDNEINKTPAGRYSFTDNSDGLVVAKKLNNITGGTTTVTTYDNTVNGYCYNYIYSEDANSHAVLKAQPGHSYIWAEALPAGASKAEDVVYHNVASVYNAETGEFEEYNLGSTMYCTHCDALISPSVLNIEVTGLAKGESEVFGVYSVVEDVETLVLNIAVTGKGTGTGTDVSTIIRLTDGMYRVKPTVWDWAYTNSAVQDVTITEGETSTASFTVTAKSDQPGHGEKARVNNFN